MVRLFLPHEIAAKITIENVLLGLHKPLSQEIISPKQEIHRFSLFDCWAYIKSILLTDFLSRL